MKHKLLVFIPLVIFACVSHWRMTPFYFQSKPVYPTHAAKSQSLALPRKKFLYLVQVKECLLPQHANNDSLFHGGEFDVLAFSYHKLCLREHPSHVKYITNNRTSTWTGGRNILYRYARKFYKNYVYYIFLDGDIILADNSIPLNVKNKRFSNETLAIIKQKGSAWRKFETFLIDYRPAIGSIENQYRMGVKFNFLKTPEIKAHYGGFEFDAQINAYHRNVWTSMLPYNETYDGKSWVLSQEIQICKAFFRYHGHMVYFIPVIALNYAHGPYPRGIDPPMELCKDEYNLAPDFMKAYALTRQLMSSKDFSTMPHFYSYVAHPKTPIREYVYFDGNFSSK